MFTVVLEAQPNDAFGDERLPSMETNNTLKPRPERVLLAMRGPWWGQRMEGGFLMDGTTG